jgi:hypothetical protein
MKWLGNGPQRLGNVVRRLANGLQRLNNLPPWSGNVVQRSIIDREAREMSCDAWRIARGG